MIYLKPKDIKRLRSQQLRLSRPLIPEVRGRPCQRCSLEKEDVVRAHYTGIRQWSFGKGLAKKCHDLASVPLCRECHEFFDQPGERKSLELSEEFLRLIIEGWIYEANPAFLKYLGTFEYPVEEKSLELSEEYLFRIVSGWIKKAA